MKFDKTYKDFLNDIITEAEGNSSSPSLNPNVQAFLKQMSTNRKQRLVKPEDYRRILRAYAESFILDDITHWRNFIRSIRTAIRGHGPLVTTKYQFIIDFFNYYFNTVYHGNTREIQRYLEQAAETIQMEEKYYTRSTIRTMRRLVRQGQRNRQLFVNVFDSLR